MSERQTAWWHAPGMCDTSTSIHESRPAAYWYVGQNGYSHSLCAPCCAVWRKNALDDPSLAPARITEIDAGNYDSARELLASARRDLDNALKRITPTDDTRSEQ